MGVLNCDRIDCENIMCDRMCNDFYICNECFEELVTLGTDVDLDEFMGSTPQRNVQSAVRAYWETRFPVMKGSPFYQEK